MKSGFDPRPHIGTISFVAPPNREIRPWATLQQHQRDALCHVTSPTGLDSDACFQQADPSGQAGDCLLGGHQPSFQRGDPVAISPCQRCRL
jgi:hypothetical protein